MILVVLIFSKYFYISCMTSYFTFFLMDKFGMSVQHSQVCLLSLIHILLTGKGLEFGGSLVRPEATGYGGLYFVREMLADKGIDIRGKRVAISGFGNVAWGAAQKATQMGAKVVTISGPDGYIYDEDGLDEEKIAYMLEPVSYTHLAMWWKTSCACTGIIMWKYLRRCALR